ncbi:hypothetical protein WA026_000504 [Henosepilachna vigintioctopunctata]|uniref:Shugoshin C-terminal domain-containing protein n=1 Tax=Henosepilachna vigintioctopunctata TaxID=420089 RepID=A0AAW1UXU3_9CUCU
MSRRIENTSTSRMSEASLDHKYLKTLNNELSKEVAELRKEQTRKQSDIDHLLSEKFNIELKYNHLYHLFSKIEERSRITLNHIVECSNELAYIMQITNRVKSLGNRVSDSPVGAVNKSRNNSLKQVVTPHAVNGHVIHTPTIRIARYNEPTSETSPKCSENNTTGQNFEDDNLSSEEDVTENDEEVINEEDREEDADEMIDASPLKENDGALSTIQEELEQSIDQDEIDQPVFSGRAQEVQVYSNQISEKITRVNNKRGSNNSTSDFSELDTSNSSVIPEASTSYNVTSKFNDDDIPYEVNILKRKSFIERKSIGSPIPSKILRRSNIKRRSSERKSISSVSMDSSSTPRKSLEFRQPITPAHLDTTESSESTLRNSSLKSFNGPIDSTMSNSDTSDAVVSTSILVPTIRSFIEKTSIHSTPSIDSSFEDVQTTIIRKLNFRKKRLNKPAANPVVNITRLSKDDMEHISMDLKKSIKNPKRSREEKSFEEKKPIKRGKSDTNKNSSIYNNSSLNKPAANPVVNKTRLSEDDMEHRSMHLKKSIKNPKTSREEKSFEEEKPINREKSDMKKKNIESKSVSRSSPNKLSLSNESSARPRRKVKPISLKEPSCISKLRRSR